MANERDVKLGLARNIHKGGTVYTHYVGKLYVPSVDEDGRNLDHAQRDRILNLVCETLSREFGGATTYDGNGYYRNGLGVLVLEPVTIVETITEEEPTDILRNIADYVKLTLRQECVLFSVQPIRSEFV